MKPRLDQVPRLLRMKPGQIRQLKRWLIVENISYKEAIVRLRDRFGVQTNNAALHNFWNRVCQPKSFVPARRILVDLDIVRTTNGWRVTCSQRFPGVNAWFNRQKLKGTRTRHFKGP